MSSGVTLVAYYRFKPRPLMKLIETSQRRLKQWWGNAYLPYELDQIHATIVGLEGHRANNKTQRSSPTNIGNQGAEIALSQALTYLKDTPLLPLQIRIGGFQEQGSFGFSSRGATPFSRSFSFQDDTAIIIGWPVSADTFPNTLFLLRKSFEQFGIFHKYNMNGEVDNDLYFVLGHLRDNDIPVEVLGATARQLRQYISRHPLTIRLSADDLWLVKYESPSLLPSSSLCWQVTKVAQDQDLLRSLFDERSSSK